MTRCRAAGLAEFQTSSIGAQIMKRATKIVIADGTAFSLARGSGMGPGRTGGYGPGYGMGPQGMYNACPGTAEERLTGLKSELGITADQDTAWQAFVKNAKQQNENRQTRLAKMHEARAAGSPP